MGAKDQYKPLATARLVEADQRATLAEAGITTVEELFGLLKSQPGEMRSLLDLTAAEFERLKTDTRAALPDATRKALESVRKSKQYYGARRPDFDD